MYIDIMHRLLNRHGRVVEKVVHNSIVIQHFIALTEQLLFLFSLSFSLLGSFNPFSITIVAKHVFLLLFLQLVPLFEKLFQFR